MLIRSMPVRPTFARANSSCILCHCSQKPHRLTIRYRPFNLAMWLPLHKCLSLSLINTWACPLHARSTGVHLLGHTGGKKELSRGTSSWPLNWSTLSDEWHCHLGGLMRQGPKWQSFAPACATTCYLLNWLTCHASYLNFLYCHMTWWRQRVARDVSAINWPWLSDLDGTPMYRIHWAIKRTASQKNSLEPANCRPIIMVIKGKPMDSCQRGQLVHCGLISCTAAI